MTAITIWLLISVNGHHAHTVERFPTVQECERVLLVVKDSTQEPFRPPVLRCIQATVVR